MSGKTGIELIVDERRRQIEEEGFTAEHDNLQHNAQELVRAAVCYLEFRGYTKDNYGEKPAGWPWQNFWKPTTYERNLVKAGALIAAAIDQHTRDEQKRSKQKLDPSIELNVYEVISRTRQWRELLVETGLDTGMFNPSMSIAARTSVRSFRYSVLRKYGVLT